MNSILKIFIFTKILWPLAAFGAVGDFEPPNPVGSSGYGHSGEILQEGIFVNSFDWIVEKRYWGYIPSDFSQKPTERKTNALSFWLPTKYTPNRTTSRMDDFGNTWYRMDEPGKDQSGMHQKLLDVARKWLPDSASQEIAMGTVEMTSMNLFNKIVDVENEKIHLVYSVGIFINQPNPNKSNSSVVSGGLEQYFDVNITIKGISPGFSDRVITGPPTLEWLPDIYTNEFKYRLYPSRIEGPFIHWKMIEGTGTDAKVSPYLHDLEAAFEDVWLVSENGGKPIGYFESGYPYQFASPGMLEEESEYEQFIALVESFDIRQEFMFDFWAYLRDPFPIINVPGPGRFALTTESNSSNLTIGECENYGTLVLKRVGGTTGDATVTIATIAGTATENSDYLFLNHTYAFKSGETEKRVLVTVLPDQIIEPDETFQVRIVESEVAGIDSADSVVVTIKDCPPIPGDGGSPVLSHTSATVSAVGGDFSVAISTGTDTAWTANSLESWIEVLSGHEVTGNGSVSYRVGPNHGAARSGRLIIGGLTFTVNQEGGGEISYPVTVARVGLGVVTGAASYPQGSMATLTATPGVNYLFSHWSGDAEGTDNPLTITVDGAKAITAHFVRAPVMPSGSWVYSGYQSAPVPDGIAIPYSFVSIAAGTSHAVALTQNGSVIGWGDNRSGQITIPVAAQNGITAIAAGDYHTVALKHNGSVVAWGQNSSGHTNVPAAAQSDITAIAGGAGFTVALRQNGSVIAWGASGSGQTNVPPAAQSGVIAIAAGDYHTLALKQNGSVVAWGRSSSGQTTVPAAAQSGIVAIAAGGEHTVALTQNGNVIAWGGNTYGQTTVPAAAQSGVIAIKAVGWHTIALKQDGRVVAWGRSVSGQTTVPATAQSGVIAIATGGNHAVALKHGGGVVAWGSNSYGQGTVPAAGQSSITAIAAGSQRTVALKQDGGVVAWYSQSAVPVAAQSGVTAIAEGAGGFGHTVALKQNGVIAWGSNNRGQTTVPTAAQSGVTAIAAGGSHTVALKDNGSVVAWGWNVYGQTTVPATAQSGVTAIAAGQVHTVALKQTGVIAWGGVTAFLTAVPTAAQSGVTAIAAGSSHTVALKQDGSVVAWGSNSDGQTTVPAAAQSGVIAIAAGSDHSVALKQDGSVVTWGSNSHGQTTVPAEAQNRVTTIAAGGNVTFFRLGEGRGPYLPGMALFEQWADDKGLEGDDALPNATPFHDGVPNLLKYAFNMKGVGPDVSRLALGTGLSGLPVFGLEESGSGSVFRLEYLRRRDAGLSYTPKVSPRLSPDSFVPMTGVETIESIDGELERVRVEQPVDLAVFPRLFGVVEVKMEGE